MQCNLAALLDELTHTREVAKSHGRLKFIHFGISTDVIHPLFALDAEILIGIKNTGIIYIAVNKRSTFNSVESFVA